MAERTLDVIGLGRAGVDFYGEQIGGRLEDMASFAKYVGGSPTNTVIGAARLGLKAALITRVGDEHMGRFIRETLEAEGVDTSHVKTDPERLTALVILGIRDRDTFPLIFYRQDCADMAIEEGDFDRDFIASAKALLLSGTHFSTPRVNRASRAAVSHARAAGTKVALDLDYRPVLWGLTGHGLGEERFVESSSVSEHLQSIVPDCDLIVGSEEEIHIAGGATDTMAALRCLRGLSDAVLVVKRGPMGCVVFEGAIPGAIEDGITGPGFDVEVFNVLGAGDAFMAGFLHGWLSGAALEDCCRTANACGAIVVSRHGCAPAMPSLVELRDFLDKGSPHRRLRDDKRLGHIHWATNRARPWPEICAFAFDHRTQFLDLAEANGKGAADIARFKRLCWRAADEAAGDQGCGGILCDDLYGQETLDAATGSGFWIGRPVEVPASRPVEFAGGADLATTLRAWPVEHCVKCLVHYHPDDEPGLRQRQERSVAALFEACRATRHELLLEIIPPSDSDTDAETVARALGRFYDIGVYPDWWKLPPSDDAAAWANIAAVVASRDPYCRGVLLLGLEAPEDVLARAFEVAAGEPLCKGFTVGRSIFNAAAGSWFAGKTDDAAAVADMAARYARLIGMWRQCKAKARSPARDRA